MLETAAVGGVEFAAATAASDGLGTVEAVEGRCAAWPPRRFLRAAGPVAGRTGPCRRGSGSPTTCRTMLYERIPAGRRARLHAAVADRLERATGQTPPATRLELAAHLLVGPRTRPGRSATSRRRPSRLWAAAPP